MYLDRGGFEMPVFRLDPIDPRDSAWAGSPFIEPVWIEAPDETAARAGVSALARMAAPSEVARRWPWFFAASCVRDDSSRSLTMGKAATAAGRILITNEEQESALLSG
jgi:hypothetical protein